MQQEFGFSSLWRAGARVALALTASTWLSACGAEAGGNDTQEDAAPIESVGVVESRLDRGFTTENCTLQQTQKLGSAIDFLLTEVTTNYNALSACIGSANLLEYKGSSANKIVDDLIASSVTKFRCSSGSSTCGNAAGGTWGACAHGNTTGVIDVTSGTIAAAVPNLAGAIAHEIMHQKGYNHAVNDWVKNATYAPLTVNQQIQQCVITAGAAHAGPRTPNPWPGPGSSPLVARIVGAHANNSCNCVYLNGGYATCGATDYLTKTTNTYKNYTLAAGKTPANVVGMVQTGSLVCAFYDDRTVSCGTQSGCSPVTNLAGTRAPYTYTLPAPYTPSQIVGMGGDDSNNNVLAWYSDGRVSVGTTDNLSRWRNPYDYQVANGFFVSQVREMLTDGSLNCVLYANSFVSCGTSNSLASSRSPYATKF